MTPQELMVKQVELKLEGYEQFDYKCPYFEGVGSCSQNSSYKFFKSEIKGYYFIPCTKHLYMYENGFREEL